MDLLEGILVGVAVLIAFAGGLVYASIKWMAYVRTSIEPLLRKGEKLAGAVSGSKFNVMDLIGMAFQKMMGGGGGTT